MCKVTRERHQEASLMAGYGRCIFNMSTYVYKVTTDQGGIKRHPLWHQGRCAALDSATCSTNRIKEMWSATQCDEY